MRLDASIHGCSLTSLVFCVLQDPSDHHHKLLPWQAFGEWGRSVKGPARQSSLHQPRCPERWEFSFCVCLCVWFTWLTLHVTTHKLINPNHLHGPNQESSHKPSALAIVRFIEVIMSVVCRKTWPVSASTTRYQNFSLKLAVIASSRSRQCDGSN